MFPKMLFLPMFTRWLADFRVSQMPRLLFYQIFACRCFNCLALLLPKYETSPNWEQRSFLQARPPILAALPLCSQSLMRPTPLRSRMGRPYYEQKVGSTFPHYPDAFFIMCIVYMLFKDLVVVEMFLNYSLVYLHGNQSLTFRAFVQQQGRKSLK